MDRFESTRGDWLAYDEAGARAAARRLPGSPLARLDESSRDLPAFLSFDEASALAARRGMRLPTPREWLHLAVGRRSLVYPYGGLRSQKSWANTLELGYGAPTPVGTFENGRSRRFDCYDLLGNVWEWVDGVVLGYLDFPEVPELEAWDELTGDRLASVMGGAFDSRTRRTFGRSPLRLHAMVLDRATLRPSIGARMCADAETYLWRSAGRWGEGKLAHARVAAVGARWARTIGRNSLLGFLEPLLKREGTPRALTWLVEGARGRG